jgi:Gpi18-like mannosyltransferase
MSAPSAAITTRRRLALAPLPRWLVGWWAVGRVVAIATAVAVKPTVWTLDRWDGHWYEMVARGGYLLVPGRPSDPAFFPLYPIMLRVEHTAGVGWGVAGPLLSNVAFLLGLVLFYRLSREIFSESLARRATTYLAIFPLSYVFSMAYPESVVLVLLLAAPLAALRGHWWLAAFCAGAAALARPEGVFLALPLADIAWRQRQNLSPTRRGAALAAILAPVAAVASYSLYLATVLHDPFAWSQAERAWGRQFRVSGAYEAFAHLPATIGNNPWLVRDVVFFFLYLALLYAARRVGTPLAWLVAGAAIVILPIFTGAFDSIGRFGLLAPPLFWGLAGLTTNARSERVVRSLLLALLVLGTASLAYVFP